MKRIALTLAKLEHALVLQRRGSFSRAAEELNLTQPTLSRSIASLEALWGIQIFERGRAGVRPTPIGSEMLAQAEQLISLARTLDSNMHHAPQRLWPWLKCCPRYPLAERSLLMFHGNPHMQNHPQGLH